MTLPNFIGIGAARSGTTSLHRYLLQHPDAFLATPKETNFFSPQGRAAGRATATTLKDYESLFDGAAGHAAIGEISPRYMPDPDAAPSIFETLGPVRIFAILRDPIARAYSHYRHRAKGALEKRPFDVAAVEGELYFEWSRYAEHLRRYYSIFPRDRIHVLLYEDFDRDPAACLRDLAGFLGLDNSFRFDTRTRHNPAGAPRFGRFNRPLGEVAKTVAKRLPKRMRGAGIASRALVNTGVETPPLSPNQAARLRKLLRGEIEATAELIGRDLSQWLDGSRSPSGTGIAS